VEQVRGAAAYGYRRGGSRRRPSISPAGRSLRSRHIKKEGMSGRTRSDKGNRDPYPGAKGRPPFTFGRKDDLLRVARAYRGNWERHYD